MATRIPNKSWALDRRLEETLQNYSRKGLQRKEMQSFKVRDFGEYFWSLRSLDRKLRHFNIHSNESVSVEDVKSVANKELMGPGRLLGCRAIHFENQKHSRTECDTRPCVYHN